MDIANPSDEHQMLREMVRDFVNEHVEPQALEYDRDEKFNVELLFARRNGFAWNNSE